MTRAGAPVAGRVVGVVPEASEDTLPVVDEPVVAVPEEVPDVPVPELVVPEVAAAATGARCVTLIPHVARTSSPFTTPLATSV
jgi:hypothetical protein